MPTPAVLLTIATLLPLASFVVLVFIGRRMGTPLAGWFATAAIAASFVCSVAALGFWYGGGTPAEPWGYDQHPISKTLKWIPVGTESSPGGLTQEHPGWLDVGVYVDSLTV